MNYIQYETADKFLERMTGIFEQTEAVNSLMFGICLQLKGIPLKSGKQPLFAIVEDDSDVHIAGLMTPSHKLVLYATKSFSGQSVNALVNGLLENSWHVPAVLAEKNLAESFAQAWTKSQRCRFREGQKQAVHELKTVNAIKYASGEIRPVRLENISIAQSWSKGFYMDCFGDTKQNDPLRLKQFISNGTLFFWCDPKPVSMAMRTRPTSRGESVCFVYTPPEYRNKGYASSLVAALSQKILDDGKKFCCLYTDLANPTSNSIYRKIGYVPVARVIDIHFDY